MKLHYFVLLLSSVFNLGFSSTFPPTFLPTATISGGTSVCQNATDVVVTFTASGGVAPYTFKYKINNGAELTITTTGGSSTVTVPVNTSNSGNLNYTLISVSDSAVPLVTHSVNGNTEFTINPQADATINSSADSGVFGDFSVFKVCSDQPFEFEFFNATATAATNTNYTIDWGDGSTIFSGTTWSSLSHTYQVGLWDLVYTVTAQNGCNVTKTYKVFVGNNPAVGLGNPGNTDICITSPLTFPITGTENNPPGTVYVVSFNDDSPSLTFNHPPPASVTHTFLKTSCGTSSTAGSTTYQNSFFASIQAYNPCDQSSASVVPIRVSTTPISNFSSPSNPVCIGSPACLISTVTDGQTATSSSCSPAKIIWSISPNTGFTMESGTLGNDFGNTNVNSWTSGSETICPVFSVAGTYTITLKAGNKCGIDIQTRTICVQPQLVPNFTLSAAAGCSPLAVTTTNTTDLSNLCDAPTYNWIVNYAAGNCGTTSGFAYTNGTSATSAAPSFSFTEAGTYTISLQTTNSCGSATSAVQTVTIKKPPIVSIAPIADACGSATISPVATINACTPSSSSLTYEWSFTGGTPSTANTANPGAISYAAPGTYTASLIVTNECGTSVAATQTFTVHPSPEITNTDLSQTICSGTSTFPVVFNATPSGATFSWTAVATTGISGFTASGTTATIPAQTISTTNTNPGAVTYTVTPKIGNCTGTAVNYIVYVIPAPTITSQPVSSMVCENGTATPLTVAVTTSTGTPSYQWYSNTANTTGGTTIPGATSATFVPPTAVTGTVFYYCVISLSSSDCSSLTSDIASVEVVPAPTISTQPLAAQNLCVGVTIASPLTVSFNNGAGTVSYQWYSSTTNATTGGTMITGATSATYMPAVFSTVGDHYYYVTLAFSGNNCGTLASESALVRVFADPTLTIQPIADQTLCQGAVPANLEVAATGGNGTFTYQWYSNTVNTTSGSLLNGETNSTFVPPTSTVGTLYYYCIVSQSTLGCAVTSSIAKVVVNPSPSVVDQPLSSTVCLGGNPAVLSFTVTNGVGTPTYQWYSNTNNSTMGGTLISGAATANYSPPTNAAGNAYYYCIITFPNLSGGCEVITSDTALITVDPFPIIASSTATICSNNPFLVTPMDGNGNLVPSGTNYTWTLPIVNPPGAISGFSAQPAAQTEISQTLVNNTLDPATITYTVTPKAGICTGDDFTVTITVNPAISPNVIVNNNNCFGANNASIATNITGGIPPYAITWAGPNGFQSNAAAISNLAPGVYTILIEDAGNCPFTNSYVITEPTDIVLSVASQDNSSCFGSNDGAIDIEVSGGTGGYSYTWTKNSLPFGTTQDLAGLSPGDYTVSVTDANNCGPKTLSFAITEPPLLVVSLLDQTNVDCSGAATGTISVEVAGGTTTALYTFLWTGPGSFTSMSQNLTGLFAGTYDLIVTDANGCQKGLEVTLTESTPIVLTYTTTAITCYGANDASFNATISGGNAPYQFTWSNLSTSLNQGNLSAGAYTITIIDTLGCIKTETINIPEAPIFRIDPVVKSVSCFGANNGSIQVNLTGGIAPVTLSWSDGSTAGLTRNNLAPGTYTATISDGTPCHIVRTFTIVEPQLLVLSANLTNPVDCTNASGGAIDLIVSGGTPPFAYSWSNGAATEDLNNLVAGNYAVVVTDFNGCTISSQYTLIRPEPLEIDVTTKNDFNCDLREVTTSFVAQASGGVPPYQFQWSSGNVSGANNEIMRTDLNGTVILTVEDAIGCVQTFTVNVDHTEIGTIAFEAVSAGYTSYGMYSIEDPIQFNSTITGDYESVYWDFGDGTTSTELEPVHVYALPKDYVVTLTVTYPFGCVYHYVITLAVEKGYILVVPTAFTPNSDSLNDTFRPVTKNLKNIVMDIYDSWGSLIYSEKGDAIKGWDARIKGFNAENGNYYSKVAAETFYGTIVYENQTFVLIK